MSELITLLSTPSGNIGGLAVDATIEEVHEESVEITEHPVEAGAAITDHSYNRPTELVMRCGWSNSSSQALLNIVSNFMADGTPPIDDYVTSVYSQLLNLKSQRQPMQVQTTLKTYANMLIRNVRIVRDQRTAQSLMVVVTFRQVILVSTSTTTLPPADAQANPANTQGVQNAGFNASPTQGTPSPGGAVDPSQWTGNALNPNAGSPASIVGTLH